MIAKLERTQSNAQQNRTITKLELCSLFPEWTTHEVIISNVHITTETERSICDKFLKEIIVK